MRTTGYAKRASAVTAHTLLNAIATTQLTAVGFWDIADTIEHLADHEGFPHTTRPSPNAATDTRTGDPQTDVQGTNGGL